MNISLILPLVLSFASPVPQPWLGVDVQLHTQPLEVDGRRFPVAIRINYTGMDSPARRAGLEAGDLIVGMEEFDFTGESKELVSRFTRSIAQKRVGERVLLTVVRDAIETKTTVDGQPLEPRTMLRPEFLLGQRSPGSKVVYEAVRRLKILKIPVTIGPRPPDAMSKKKIARDEEIFSTPIPPSLEETLARSLVREQGFEANLRDLQSRLARLQETGDEWRLARLAYVHRNPFSLSQVARRLLQEVEAIDTPIAGVIERASEWLDNPPPPVKLPRLAPKGLSVDERIDEVVEVLRSAKVHYDRAFAAFTDDEMLFLLGQLNVLGNDLTRHLNIDDAFGQVRVEGNRRAVGNELS